MSQLPCEPPPWQGDSFLLREHGKETASGQGGLTWNSQVFEPHSFPTKGLKKVRTSIVFHHPILGKKW